MPHKKFKNGGDRGRGRGNGFRGGRGRGQSRGGRGRGGYGGSSFHDDELDFTIQMYADSPNPPEGYAPRGRGRGRGNARGTPGSRGRGKTFGIGASPQTTPSKTGGNSTLSNLLFSSRPLLRPVVFVPSTQSRYLFNEEEEILQPVAEEIGDDDASHVPTADQVNRIFSGLPNPFEEPVSGFGSSSSSSSDEDGEEEELEEIDFNDMQKLLEPTTSPKHKRKVKVDSVMHMVQEQVQVTGFYRSSNPAPSVSSPSTEITERIKEIHIAESPVPSRELNTTMQALDFTPPPPPPLFIVDTGPGVVPPALEAPKPDIDVSSDEEVIVYVAPHPRHGPRASSTFPTTPKKNNDLLPGPIPQVDTSKFQPYTPPAMLSLAATSIRESPSLSPLPSPSPSPSLSLHETDVNESESTVQPQPQPLTAPIPTIQSLKFEFSSLKSQVSSSRTSENSSSKNGGGRKLPSIMSPRMVKKQTAWERKKAKREAKKFGTRSRRTKKKGHVLGLGHMAAFGAIMSEAMMRGEEVEDVMKDSRWEERRRGDSDLDWGDEDKDEMYVKNNGKVNGTLNGIEGLSEKAKGKQRAIEVDEDDHGMDVDPELEINLGAMKSFIGGLIGADAGNFVTMDDVEVEQKIREEDEEGQGGPEGSSDNSSSSEDEDEDSDTSDSDDDDDFNSPKSSFQARLDRLRKRSREAKQGRISPVEDDDELFEQQMLWAEAEEGLFDDLQEFLDDGDVILKGRNRKERNKRFNAVLNGQFQDDHDGNGIDYANMQPAKKRKDKGKDLPADIHELWELDRQKKAERRRERDLQKITNASDPLSKKKGGKKGRKAMLRAAKYESTINVLPNRVIDITTLVQQIRRFVANLDGPSDMQLPPADNATRKCIHEVARVFHLTSKSKGKDETRYTTLTKTSRTGEGRVDENLLNIVCRRFGRGTWISSGGYEKHKGSGGGGGNGGGRGNVVPKHKEGDEVGGAAPKIGQGNKGFKMLAMMGWTEGDRIGLSGGLENPLVAIIKHSKLGLGATK